MNAEMVNMRGPSGAPDTTVTECSGAWALLDASAQT